MTSKKALVLSLIIVQAFILLFLIKSKVWNQHIYGHRFRDVWTTWKNDSEAVEPDAEVFGVIDLNDQQFSWLKEPAHTKNITRSTYTPTTFPTTANVSTETSTLSYSLGSKIIKPAIDQSKGDIFLLILVTTTPKSLERRKLIRNTWAKAAQTSLQEGVRPTNLTTYVVFMLGITGDAEQDSAVEEESEKYGDILRAPSIEYYRNIISKVWYAFEWALPYHPKYILKVDDDIYVRIPRFASWLSEDNVPSDRLYAGYVHYRAYISRNPKNKHYVSKSEYKRTFFPNYCAGPCYTFSGDLLDEFLLESKTIPKFKVEDAYLGLVAKRIGVRPFDIGGKLFVWDRSLSRSVRRWNDRKLSRVLCLGDSLTLDAIKYIHGRFEKIDRTFYQVVDARPVN